MKEKPRKPQNRVTNEMKSKAIVVTSVFLVAVMFIVYNMVDTQIIRYEEYQSKASSNQLQDTKISAKRGTIYDANMKVLSQSATVWTVFVSPAESKEDQHTRIAQRLGEILEVDSENILAKLKKTGSYYEIIKYKIDKPKADEVRQFCIDEKIKGVNLVEDFKRYYPYGDFAATVLGFCGTDNQGLAGIESYYNEELTGVQGRVISAKNGWGLDMGYEYEELNKAQDGYSVVSTIDETIQHYLEKHLEYAEKEYDVQQRAVGIVMNVKTGAILAMSTKPDFDPNEPYVIKDEELQAVIDTIADAEEKNKAVSDARQAQWRNKAVSDLYEPGSVFKIVTASSTLDSGAANLNASFHCAGYVNVGGWKIGCNQTSGHGTLNFTQAFINSCNPSFIDMGQRMGVETFCDYFEGFGMSEKTGIDLPGEQQSQVYNAKTMGIVELASNSFGQTFKITPVQMITAVATAVNGGQLVVPHVVSKLLDEDGNTVKDLTPEPKRQVISEEVSRELCNMLLENGTTGNAKHSYVTGYRVGGKSGTSQKIDTPREDDYIASYVGVAPCDDPEIAVLIFFDDPNTYSYYGGVLAGPVVGALMGEILPYLGVEPVYTEEESSKVSTTVPSITGMSAVDAQVKLQRLGFTVKAVGSGTQVISQFPTYGMRVPKGSMIIAYTDAGAESVMVAVPNLVGKSAREVYSTLSSLGLNIEEEGTSTKNSSAVVSKQSINQGDKVPLGTVLTVTFGATDAVE